MRSTSRIAVALLAVVGLPACRNCEEQNLDKPVCAFVVNPHDRRADDPPGADNRQLLFGEVNKGSSRIRTITIDNTASNVPLTSLSITFSPTNRESYALDGPIPQVSTNQSTVLPIVFSPVPLSGDLGNTVTISHPEIDGAACPTFTVTLLGRALPPLLPDAGNADAAEVGDAGSREDAGSRDGGSIHPRDDGGPGLSDAGHFEARGGLQLARSHAGAARLPDGRVLVAGGFDHNGQVTASVELVDPHTGVSTFGPSMGEARARHSVTALSNGRIVVVGGVNSGALDVAAMVQSTEVYDPDTGEWTRHAMDDARADHVAVSLGDQVLVAYGVSHPGGQPLAQGALLVNASGSVSTVNADTAAQAGRQGVAAVEMEDGSVLLVGGYKADGPTADVVRFAAGTLTTLGASLISPRAFAAAARFKDGAVVVAGGQGPQGVCTDVEVLDPGSAPETWHFTASTAAVSPRLHAMVLRVADDVILVAGGVPEMPASGHVLARADAELLIRVPGLGLVVAGTLNAPSIPRVHAAAASIDQGVLLMGGSATAPRRSSRPDVERFMTRQSRFETVGLVGPGGAPSPAPGNRLVVAGGVDSSTGRVTSRTRIHDFATKAFVEGPSMLVARAEATATLLGSGGILVAGGRGADNDVLGVAERLDGQLTGTQSAGPMRWPRRRHTATLLLDGRVLLCGGLGSTADALDGCELFDPGTGVFTAVPGHMVRGRYDHSATLLDDGRVLLTGGNDPALGVFRGDLFNPHDNTLQPTEGFPHLARRGHAAALVGTGQVLLAGGETYAGARVPTDSAELFDGATGQYQELPSLKNVRESPASLRFAGGMVLITGGSQTVTNDPDFVTRALQQTEVYEPSVLPLGDFRNISLELTTPRARPVGVDCPGNPVVLGGEGRHGVVVSGIEARVPLTTMDVWVP